MTDWVDFAVFGIICNFVAVCIGVAVSSWKLNRMQHSELIKYRAFIDGRALYIISNNTISTIRLTQLLFLIPTYSVYIYTVYVYNILRYSGLSGAIRSVVEADNAAIIRLIKYNPNDNYCNK